MIKEVALYLRKSREDEEKKEETLARHEKMLLDYCSRNKLTVTAIYKEVVSGENITNRPEMQRLLDDVAAGLYNGVVCVEIERLSRGNQLDQVEILDVFKSSGTKIYTLNKIYDLNQEEIDEEYFEFALFMSRREYKTIKRRLLRGRLQATKEGYYIASTTPYGFDKVRGEKGFILVPNEKEAGVVKYIFDQYIAGVGTNLLAKALNEKGIKTKRGCYWVPRRVKDIVKNKIYIGYIHSSKLNTWVQGKHEPLIDIETFEKARAIYATDAPKIKAATSVKNPLAGLVFCPCGYRMQRSYNSHRNYEYLACNKTPLCSKKLLRLDLMEKEVLKQLKEILKGYNYFIETETPPKNTNELDLLNRELKTKEGQIVKACELLEQSIYDITLFKKRTALLEKEIENIKARLAAIESATGEKEKVNNAIPILEKVLEKYPTLDVEQKNKLLRAIIKRIDVNGEELKIELLI